ncbi:MAG: AAA family ATPase [Chloroflexota bacterium]
MLQGVCIVVTGLPASGKSTFGKRVAAELELPLLDKDDFLEQLYKEKGVGDRSWRQMLSRESDERFKHAAAQYDSV